MPLRAAGRRARADRAVGAEPDERCAGGREAANTTVYQPTSSRFRLHAAGSKGFYYTLCGD